MVRIYFIRPGAYSGYSSVMMATNGNRNLSTDQWSVCPLPNGQCVSGCLPFWPSAMWSDGWTTLPSSLNCLTTCLLVWGIPFSSDCIGTCLKAVISALTFASPFGNDRPWIIWNMPGVFLGTRPRWDNTINGIVVKGPAIRPRSCSLWIISLVREGLVNRHGWLHGTARWVSFETNTKTVSETFR